MNAEAVLKKIHVKPGVILLVQHALAELGQDLAATTGDIQLAGQAAGTYPAVLLFVQSQADLAERAPAALRAVEFDGLLWIAYPKHTSMIKTDIHRDQGWEPVNAAGWVPVTQIAIDETWSVLSFRSKARVGK